MTGITAVRVPKWGLSMAEGTIVAWNKAIGDAVSEGDELVDIETAKITNVALAPGNGVLRRITVELGQTLPVGALIGIIADAGVSDAEIDAFIADFTARFGAFDANAADESAFVIASVDSRLGPVSVGQRGDGSGDTVLLIHGFASDMNSWGFNLEEFGRGRTVVAVDLPGHGTSTKSVGDGSVAALADALGDVLDRLAVERVHLVGHSLGGAIALQLAERLGDRLGRIVLIAPAGIPGGSVSEPFLDGLLSARRQRELRGYLEMLVADPARITHEMVDDIIRFRRVDGVMPALEAIRDRIVEGAQFATLAEVIASRQPLVIVGAEDRIVGVPASVDGASALHVVADAGHMPHVEAPHQVNALVAPYLD